MRLRFVKTFAVYFFIFVVILFSASPILFAQEEKTQNALSTTWVVLQTIPSLTWLTFPEQTHFAFEWEVTPILYSFGMTKLDPPWHFLSVTQPERFAGSLELNFSTQLYTKKVGTSHWGFSGQLLTHLPLIQKGEYLGFNAGFALYFMDGTSSKELCRRFFDTIWICSFQY